MRYENPLYLAEEAAALDLIADGHTALGVSFGAPEIAYKGWESFGYHSDERNGADLARTVIGREVSRVDQRLVIKPGGGGGGGAPPPAPSKRRAHGSTSQQTIRLSLRL